MDTNSNKNKSDFKSPDDAFEYLVNQRLDEKRRKEWAEALGPPREKAPIQQVKQKKSNTMYIRLASIAAAAIIFLGFFLFTQRTKPLDQYAGKLMQEIEVVIDYGSSVRGENTEVEDKNVTALKNELTSVLLDKDFNQALGYFKQLEKITTLNTEDKYFFALSLLKSKGEDYQKAVRLLNDVISENGKNQANALWMRSLAYGMTDNSVLMKADLNQMKLKTNKKHDKVNTLLSRY